MSNWVSRECEKGRLSASVKRVAVTLLTVLSLFCATIQCHGQGTIRITFDGPPVQPPGTEHGVQQYYESGMWFRPLGPSDPGNQFGRHGGGVVTSPENGTAYVRTALGESLMFSFSDGTIFNMVSVDLAEYSTVVPVLTVTFVGYRQDGSSVTADLTPDGIIDGTGPLADFQTFYFDKEWADLTRVEIPTYGWSLDNLVVATIPEPTVGALLLVGGLLLWSLRHTRTQGANQCGSSNPNASVATEQRC